MTIERLIEDLRREDERGKDRVALNWLGNPIGVRTPSKSTIRRRQLRGLDADPANGYSSVPR